MPDNYRTERDAIRGTLESALENASPGDQAIAQSAGQIDTPHYHAGQTSGEKHTDAYVGTKQSDGSVKVEKIHSDD